MLLVVYTGISNPHTAKFFLNNTFSLVFMSQKHLELTVHEAMDDISGYSFASLAGLVTVHSSVFRNVPLMKTYVDLTNESGPVVAERFGWVKIPVVSEAKQGIGFKMAKLLNGQVRVQKVSGEKSVLYSLKGDVDNPFNRGWFGLGRQTYHYAYTVKVDFVVAASPAYYSTA